MRVEDVIDGVRRIGRHEEEEVIEVGCQVNALIRELCEVAGRNSRQQPRQWRAGRQAAGRRAAAIPLVMDASV